MTAWPEELGRHALAERSGGQCEIHGDHLATDWSHRRARAHGGTWAPWNGLHICHRSHMWLEAEPDAAAAGGWRLVHDERDPMVVPVWLARPWPGWWWLTVDIVLMGDRTRAHIMVPVDDPGALDLPDRPHRLPPRGDEP